MVASRFDLAARLLMPFRHGVSPDDRSGETKSTIRLTTIRLTADRLNWARFSLTATTLLVLFATSSMAQEVDFESQVWSIFETRCADCHAGANAEARFRVDAKQPFFAGGVSGSPLHETDPEGSLLLQRLKGTGDLDQMPPDDDPLTDEEIEIIETWIDGGANWPDSIGEQVEVNPHWAYVAPKRPSLPTIDLSSWPRNAIDYFVLAAIESRQWSPSAEAEEAILVRRIYLDLIGIPPTPSELDAYLADTHPNRYERLVSDLIASPQYGVRWARPWLDQARYADSNGYQADQYREVWAYRDWVIRAINNDMPFDQFTIEQLAGDLLADATLDQRIATGFHRLTTCNVEAGVDPEENRVNQIIDRVNTTATVWMGTTMECVQCHNHKYDPFTQRDYYSMFAYFNQTPLEVKDSGNSIQFEFVGPKMDLPLTDEQQRTRSDINRQLTELRASREGLVESHLTGFDAWATEIVKAKDITPEWIPLEPVRFESSHGSTATLLDDLSVLVGGARPDKEDYYLAFQLPESGIIQSIQLETLTDDSLPGSGPGRHDPERPNFVLNEFTAGILAQANVFDAERLDEIVLEDPIAFTNAVADFAQKGFQVSGLIDGDATTGWAINPQFHKAHWAQLESENSITIDGPSMLVVQLDQNYGGTRTIGRLRVSISSQRISTKAIPDELLAIASKPSERRSPAETRKLTNKYLESSPEISEIDKQIATLQGELNKLASPTTLVMIENEEPRETHVFVRGDFLTPSGIVQADTPGILHPQDANRPPNRLGLAQWLVDEQNPLTARVITNRWWSEFFGHGIVATQEDFGTQGDRPTHPKLLDWLAVELMESGWSMKHVHRLIVTSSTYRQSSKTVAKQYAADPENRWYARGSRFRLPAETIRDNALRISDSISFDMDGPPIYPPQPAGVWRHVGRNAPKYDTSQNNARFRRGIYVVWRRSAPYPSFVNFDAPDRASCIVSRPRTNTPLQALTLLNDPAYLELVEAFDSRTREAFPISALRDRLNLAFRCCVSREPSQIELNYLTSTYMQEFALRASSLMNLSDSSQADSQTTTPLDRFESMLKQLSPEQTKDCDQYANRFIAGVLLNLDETITRE